MGPEKAAPLQKVVRYHIRWIGKQISHGEMVLRRGSVRKARNDGTDEQSRQPHVVHCSGFSGHPVSVKVYAFMQNSL